MYSRYYDIVLTFNLLDFRVEEILFSVTRIDSSYTIVPDENSRSLKMRKLKKRRSFAAKTG